MIHCYKLNGFNIVLDIESGSVHHVDDVAFDVISMYEAESADTITAHIKQKYASEITETEILEIIADIEELKRQGKLFSQAAFEPVLADSADTPLKALCLNVSHMCNMTCGYCFAGSGEYGGGGLMSIETGKLAIDFLLKHSDSRKNLDVDFFGGEPLLNWDTVKAIVEYAREKERELNGLKKFRFTLTTNGLLIDDEVINFTSKEMHNVVLSLDGRSEINDATRKLINGGGSYDAVLPNLKKLVDARSSRGYYIRGTFTRKNTDFVNDILHIADLGFSELSMEPVVAKPDSDYALTERDLPELCEQYELLATEMIRRKKQGRGFTFYHYMLDLTGGPCVHKRISGCGVGTEYLAVTPRGELYPCHQFIGDKQFLVGNVWSGIQNQKLRDSFNIRNIYTTPECRDCWAKMYCSGGCAANNYNASGSVHSVYQLGCELFKKRVECAIMIKVAEALSL
ncbi:MAG: thioether cross-link-forming SCIFF peptide maturase [Oscillospiraceae bacterium]|nr:thioether cross-link-forming SCIFF peptide maturase [Oscillospiraceae bacterium]